jgi:hypothetical protein
MRKIFWVAGLILLAGLVSSCEKKGEQQRKDESMGKMAKIEKETESKPNELPKPAQEEMEKAASEERMITGVVRYSDLEGGFYELAADSGERYDPINLPGEYKKDGLRVRFQIEEQRDMAGIHMRGKIVKIIKIERL